MHVAAASSVAVTGFVGSALASSPSVAVLFLSLATTGVLGAHGPFWPLPSKFLTGSAAEFLERIQGGPVTIDQWQLEKLALVTTRQRLLWYVPGLPAGYHAGLWGQSYATVESALEALASTLEPGAKVAVIPDGPYVLAKVRAHAMTV
jgi:hypothetical protein